MWNIFIVIFCLTLAFAFFDPNFFVAYLISIAVFGLFQAIYMANAGGAWDNAKKLVEVDLKEKGTAAARRDGRRRHGRRSVQGHDVGGAQPDHQVLDAVRPAGRRDRRSRTRRSRARSASCCCWSRCSSSTARSTACASRARARSRRGEEGRGLSGFAGVTGTPPSTRAGGCSCSGILRRPRSSIRGDRIALARGANLART